MYEMQSEQQIYLSGRELYQHENSRTGVLGDPSAVGLVAVN
jgi:hypothetical protein